RLSALYLHDALPILSASHRVIRSHGQHAAVRMPLQRAELHAAGGKVGGRLRVDGLERTQSDPDAIQVRRDFPLLRKGRRFVGTRSEEHTSELQSPDQ